jgi:UDP-N-acetylglucosamine diphosphorylase/glucosamine-1-phosphate N-acetyltransferase
MSTVFLYDDALARAFEPFALTRPMGEMRAGALLVRERWSRVLGAGTVAYLAAPHLRGFAEPGAASVHEGVVPTGAWLVNARFAPSLQVCPIGDRLVARGRTVAVRVPGATELARFDGGIASLDDIAGALTPSTEIGGWWIDEVWDFVGHLVPMLMEDLPILGATLVSGLPAASIAMGAHPVFVHPTAEIEPSVCFDTGAGPILIEAEAHVQAFTRLVGPLYVGRRSTVTTDRIAASSIGDTCKVHGEMSNTIMLGHANKGHDGFVGHSILGRWVNLGAGTITSNLKNTYGTVHLWTPQGVRETGLQLLGTLFGDHAKTGIGLRLTTGSVLGAGCNVYGSVMPPKAVAPFTWGEAGAFTAYRIDKFLDVAERMMTRRRVDLGEGARAQLIASHAARWSVDA